MKVNISLFYGMMRVQEFLYCEIDIDRFFDVMGISETKKVKMDEIRLNSIDDVWWNKLIVKIQRQRNGSSELGEE